MTAKGEKGGWKLKNNQYIVLSKGNGVDESKGRGLREWEKYIEIEIEIEKRDSTKKRELIVVE